MDVDKNQRDEILAELLGLSDSQMGVLRRAYGLKREGFDVKLDSIGYSNVHEHCKYFLRLWREEAPFARGEFEKYFRGVFPSGGEYRIGQELGCDFAELDGICMKFDFGYPF